MRQARPPGLPSALVEAPPAEAPRTALDTPLRDQGCALGGEVEDLLNAAVQRLVDHDVGDRDEHLVQQPGSAERAQHGLAALAVEITAAPVGKQAAMRPPESVGALDFLDDQVDPFQRRAARAEL